MSFLDRLFGKKASAGSEPTPARSSPPLPKREGEESSKLPASTSFPSMDASAVNEIVRARGGAGALLSLEEFFTGNNDMGSIGCNLSSHPGTELFYIIFMAIRERPDVSDVRVIIREFNDLPDEWPFSDTIYVVTSASQEVIYDLAEPLLPDDVKVDDTVTGLMPLSGQHVVSVWWD